MVRFLFFVCAAAATLAAQEGHGITPADIRAGAEIFLSKCASCHGQNGDGVSGVNLASNRFRHAQSDRELMDIVQKGIAGTPMPPGSYTDSQAAKIVAYLHAMGSGPKVTSASALTGDPARGQAIVTGKGECLGCHRIGSAGTVAGPDLSTIGAARRAADLELSLTDPSAEIRPENQPMHAVTRDGTVITGILLNQDTYSLQILRTDAKLMSLRKDRLKSFEILKTSPMPSYKDRLSAQELADTVSYLVSLR